MLLFSKKANEEMQAIAEDISSYSTDVFPEIISELKKRKIDSTKKYYYMENDEQKGPLSLLEFYDLYEKGGITSKTAIWYDKLGNNWTPVSNLAWFPQENTGDVQPPNHASSSPKKHRKKVPFSILLSSIITFVFAGIWSIVVISQFTFNAYSNLGVLIAFWNLAIDVFLYFIAVDLLQGNYSGYRNGKITFILGIVYYLLMMIFFLNFIYILSLMVSHYDDHIASIQ